MQLRSVRISGNQATLQIQAPLIQWLHLLGLSVQDFETTHNGDIFQLIKWMNGRINKEVFDDSQISTE